MIDFIGMQTVEELSQVRGIAQVTVVKKKAHAVEVGVAVEMVDARGVERARPTDYTVCLVTLGEKELGEGGSVLADDSCD